MPVPLGQHVEPPLPVRGVLVAPNICYEDLFGEEIARTLRGLGMTAIGCTRVRSVPSGILGYWRLACAVMMTLIGRSRRKRSSRLSCTVDLP